MAGLRPGTSPPPVRMPMTPFLVMTLAITVESPFREMRKTKLSPVKRFLGRAKPEICFLQRSDAKIWRLQLGYDLCAEDHEEFGEQGMERGPGRAGDQVAVGEGIGHGEIDVRASCESNVRAGGRIGAALLPFKDSSGGENLRGVTDSGEGLISF